MLCSIPEWHYKDRKYEYNKERNQDVMSQRVVLMDTLNVLVSNDRVGKTFFNLLLSANKPLDYHLDIYHNVLDHLSSHKQFTQG